ncbi:hypothetical protein Tco_0823018 [Tanacetum coccineum]|uniref:Uncharacterized protein n=1 Tax=Tanacetum coccineum TaxID=301880 RepID=A0ABQ5AII8_9ASTR
MWMFISIVHDMAFLNELTASRPELMFAVCVLHQFQIVTMLEQILTGNPQQKVVNFLAEDLFLGSAKSRPLWLLLLLKQNMLLLQAAVGKFCGFRIKCLKEFREWLSRVTNGTEALLLPTLFMILWLDKDEGASSERPSVALPTPSPAPTSEVPYELQTDSSPAQKNSLLTLKPLPKIDPKDKGKKKIKEEDESESESDGIPQAEKKFKQLESDEELARKIQEYGSRRGENRIAEEMLQIRSI